MSSQAPARQTAVFADFNDWAPCPIAPDGSPLPDPEASWEATRQAWLAPRPRPAEAPPRKTKDPIFAARLASLEQMLRVGRNGEEEIVVEQVRGKQGGTSTESGAQTAGAATGGSGQQGKQKQPSVDDMEPDGGMVIREKAGDELRRASESILLAFKQARPLKEALPLSLVTSLLYRSWELDGTIPSDHPSLLAPPPRPSLPPSASQSYAPSPPTSATATPPPPPPELPPIEPPNLEGMGGAAEDGKLKVDMLRGSRWRTEKEVASGSDVI
ncbi:hypothetical protein BCR35DRAFT_299562 [Leucosporidium creatinivorum]|uniref:Uncharacterized protein n=1 Tax=Leucosporidium creatinivorum TaxID=106004 RepID=A0A1Y2G383_9BASI|nr:hypothetical protein BCR35DRAFT_299562 [Leucosporidium creatinivorum]